MLHTSLIQAATLEARPGGKSIKTCIDQARAGDTLLIHAGHYHEGNINLNKRLYLRGIGWPVLDGDKKYEIISVHADSVHIEGLRIINSGYSSLNDIAGIRLYGSKGSTIRNNQFDNNCFGVYSEYGRSCLIEGNRFRAYGKEEILSGNGIHCWKSDDMRIIGNDIQGQRDGIYFEFVTNSIIWRNNSHGNIRYGLHFMFSHHDAYISNIFSRNGAGVAVMFTHGIRMFNNFFEWNWGDAAYGLLLKEISDSYIEGNYFSHNTTGLHMEGSSRIQILRNVFERNGFALRIQGSCEDDSLLHNDFVGNTFDVATNSSVSRNFFSENYWDKYEGYDLKHDGIGDVPYHPVSLFSTVVENNPPAMMLFRSFMVTLLDKTEKVLPSITPAGLKDDSPMMKRNVRPPNIKHESG
ncbi:MAG: nitrous oxide reductase family maturation protein NosD [Bacteroidetes bacterium]|nr:nitrous oxide reductase family maturation protein NosD [Bacteroidota bacterium]